jgi:hypothetical protein
MIPASWLTGIFGTSSQTASLGPSETLAYYQLQVKSGSRQMEQIAKDPTVKRELAALDKALAKAKTPEELLQNPEARRVLLQGLGLADQAEYPGLAIRVLTSDLKDAKSLVKQLPDTRWLGAATQLDFAASGLDKLKDPAVLKSITDGYIKYKYLTQVSEQSQAVSDALYLQERKTGTYTDAYTVLGDTVLRRIATTVAGIPQELALQEVDAQVRTLNARFDMTELTDPAKRDKLIQRYLAMSGAAASAGASMPDLTTLAVGASFGRINTLA